MYLTPHGPNIVKGAASDLSEAGAPDGEITPAMIEAGASEMSAFELKDVWEGYLSPEELVVRIYRAMSDARSVRLREPV